MNQELVPLPSRSALRKIGMQFVPALIADAGDKASRRFIEFFTAQIRNKNTRRAYVKAVARFCDWCAERGIRLETVQPVVVAAYVEQLGLELSKPSVKQHLAAIRMLFDYLVTGQVEEMPFNPATSVRGPKYVVKKGKSPVLSADEARELLDAIDISKIAGIRDRALIGVMVYSFARIGAVLDMDIGNYYQQGKKWWIRLHEKGGKHHEVPAHHTAEEYLDAYIDAAGGVEAFPVNPKTAGHRKERRPLFRSLNRKLQLSDKRFLQRDALAMVKRRAAAAGLGRHICNHTFRATGITAYLSNGGHVEKAPPQCTSNTDLSKLAKLGYNQCYRIVRVGHVVPTAP